MPQIASKRYSSISIKEIRRTLFPKNQKNLFVFCLSHRNKITDTPLRTSLCYAVHRGVNIYTTATTTPNRNHKLMHE